MPSADALDDDPRTWYDDILVHRLLIKRARDRESKRERERQTEREIDRERETHTEREIDRWIDKWEIEKWPHVPYPER